MASEESDKPIELKPEEPIIEVPVASDPVAPEPTVVTPPVDPAATTAAAAPPADPAKQIGDAAHQVGAGVDQALSGVTDQNRVLIVAVVSILFGGWLGSILNGQVMKGVAILVVMFVCIFLGFVLAAFTFGLSFFFWFILHIVAVVDAIMIANRKTKGEKFGEWDFFFSKPAPKA